MPRQKQAPKAAAPHDPLPGTSQNAAVQKVLSLVTARLREGKFVPGQSIIARDLAAELGLSAAPVREALHILAGQGVIDLLPQRSPRIRSLSGKDMIDILTVWRGLGAISARLAALNIGGKGNAQIVKAAMQKLHDTAKRGGSAVELLGATLDYNVALDVVSGNRYLPIVKGQLHLPHLHRHLGEYWPGQHYDTVVRNLEALSELILKGDARGAEKAFISHLDSAIAELQRAFDRAETP